MKDPDKLEDKLVLFTVMIWLVIVVLSYIHVSGIKKLDLFDFPVARGNLAVIESYKRHNILTLRENLYALPWRTDFYHPSRKKLFKNKKIFTASSVEEAKRMIDAGTEMISDKLKFVETYLKYSIFLNSNNLNYYGVVAMDPIYKTPLMSKNAYYEIFLGNSLEESKIKVEELLN